MIKYEVLTFFKKNNKEILLRCFSNNNNLIYEFENMELSDIYEKITDYQIKDAIILFDDSVYMEKVLKLKEDFNYIAVYIEDNICTLLKEDRESIFECDIESEEEAKTLIEHIDKAHKLISVIVLSFNNIKYTLECLNSIIEHTAYPNYEIILVDNNSDEKTQKILKEIKNDKIKLILNRANLGFAKGNNIGIKNSLGDYIILLNNDTVVTKGWMFNLIKTLEKDKSIGAVGPITNYAANEAQISTSYKDILEMHDFANYYTCQNTNIINDEIEMLIMFCFCMRREMVTQIGYLDENFGVGMFEDDDYSYRIKKEGYKLACTKDVFIHHYGSVSFKQLGYFKIINLMEKNKALFKKKWNKTWIPHHLRKKSNWSH